jgi:hypothetical protein
VHFVRSVLAGVLRFLSLAAGGCNEVPPMIFVGAIHRPFAGSIFLGGSALAKCPRQLKRKRGRKRESTESGPRVTCSREEIGLW